MFEHYPVIVVLLLFVVIVVVLVHPPRGLVVATRHFTAFIFYRFFFEVRSGFPAGIGIKEGIPHH